MIDHMTTRQKELLLVQCMYRITPDQRRHLMREVPDAYNAWCQSPVVSVTINGEQL